MLGGRYSIATNNIHQKDVGSVEVMTNHQPIKLWKICRFRKTCHQHQTEGICQEPSGRNVEGWWRYGAEERGEVW